MTKERFCKHCGGVLPEWQAKNAESCQDTECIKRVRNLRGKIQREKMKAKKLSTLKRTVQDD